MPKCHRNGWLVMRFHRQHDYTQGPRKFTQQRLGLTVLGFATGLFALGNTLPAAHAESVGYEIVTNEIAAKQTDGSKVEVYRFDPGVFVVTQGDDVTLRFRGIKGQDHPVVLEDYNLKTVIHRTQVTSLHFKATKPGMFRLVCTLHADAAHEGPMEGYLIVVPHPSHP